MCAGRATKAKSKRRCWSPSAGSSPRYVAALRHRTFYSLADLNAAIAVLLDKLDGREMRHVKASRRARYERLERPMLKPLPATPYAYADWKQVKVNIDYHVSFDDRKGKGPRVLDRGCRLQKRL